MSPRRRGGPIASAIGVALFVLTLQLVSTLVVPIGDVLRNLPVVPAVLIAVTAFIGIQLIRSR